MELPRDEFNQNNGYSLIESHIYSQSLNTQTNTSFGELTIAHPIIKPWVYWLGADLVSQWRTLPGEEWSLSTIFQEVNPELTSADSPLLDALAQSRTDNCSFVAYLDIEYQNIYQQQLKYFTTTALLKWVIPVTANLANSLTKLVEKFLEQLETKVEQLEAKNYEKLQIYFCFLKSAGTKTAFAFTNSLSENLQALCEKYEWQQQDYFSKSNASKHSFENLSIKISQWWQPDKQQKADSALNALLLTYKFQLKAQLCNVAGKLLRELETQTLQHTLMLAEIDLWLSQLQSWFIQQYPLDPIPINFLKQYLSPRIDVCRFLEDIEECIGKTRYQWTDLDSIELEHLKEQILIRLQPICWEFYVECFQPTKKLNSSNSFKKLDT